MDSLPFDFCNALMFQANDQDRCVEYCQGLHTYEYAQLSGLFGIVAQDLLLNQYFVNIAIYGGQINVDAYNYGPHFKPFVYNRRNLKRKYCVGTAVRFSTSRYDPTPDAEILTKNKEIDLKAVTDLVLETDFDQKWLDLFLSWDTLRFLTVIQFRQPSYELLKRLVPKQHLHSLYLSQFDCDEERMEVLCDLLKKELFYYMSIMLDPGQRQRFFNRIMTQWKQKGSKMQRKLIRFEQYVKSDEFCYPALDRNFSPPSIIWEYQHKRRKAILRHAHHPEFSTITSKDDYFGTVSYTKLYL
ncbi:hypothetical protein L596_004273 [Steinernema carpocapsae]|uniref:Uncharacterized protein n=1 Tax=Steinernema carpocapsae TaxID=34508 RepID=A0A4U8UWX7_STECR|nr:hypothetical protein L596_004273 [Steinernema carpocapsae]